MIRRFRVQWSDVARRDLARVIDYIVLESPANGKRVFQRIKKTAGSLERAPARGRVVPELMAHGVTQYRELILAPWRLMYRIADHTVFVLAFIDSRRNVEDILLHRLLDEH